MTVLGSGSAGNSIYLEAGQTRLLIDAGLSPRQLRQRLAGIGRVPETLTAILVSHEHSDHVRGLKGLADKLRIPVYCNGATRDAIREIFDTSFDLRVFQTGTNFTLGDVEVCTFAVPHDAQDPVGFVLQTEAGTIALLTDLGHVTTLVTERVRRANVLVLESNHDREMLINCPHRPWRLKQRILGSFGHLSNDDAAALLRQVAWDGLSHIYLAHISRDCNRPELAYETAHRALREVGALHLQPRVTSQDMPCLPPLELD